MKTISVQLRERIISLLDSDLSSRQIGAQLGVGHMTVSRVRATARSDIEKSQGGRPVKLTASDKRRLVRTITSGKANNPIQAARELKDTAEVEGSAQTVRRALKEAGLKAEVKKKKPRLLPRHV